LSFCPLTHDPRPSKKLFKLIKQTTQANARINLGHLKILR
jgi:hypothetical protein